MAAWVSGLGSNDPNRARRHRGRSMGRGRRCYPEEYNSKAVVLCLDKVLGQGNWVGGNGRLPNRREGNSVYRRLPLLDTKPRAQVQHPSFCPTTIRSPLCQSLVLQGRIDYIYNCTDTWAGGQTALEHACPLAVQPP